MRMENQPLRGHMMRGSLIAATAIFGGCSVMRPLSCQGTLVLKPQVTAGQYETKAQVDPYTQSSIHHLILKLYTFDGSEHDQNIQKTLFNEDLSRSVTFTNLKPNITYRVKAYAYFSEDNSVLISTSDVNSYTDIVLGTDDRPTITTLKVRLIDRDFSGQATASGVIVNSGSFLPAGSEQMKYLCQGFVTTLAGLKGTAGAADGTGSAAKFNNVYGIAVDGAGNAYVGDRMNHAIRKITPAGVVTTFAGTLQATGSVDATGNDARFNQPLGITIDGSGNLYVADGSNQVIRKVTSQAVVTTIAGAFGSGGAIDGTGFDARFNSPHGIAVDSSGNIYTAEYGGQAIRKITPSGVVSTFAGAKGISGTADGIGTMARFYQPQGLAFDDSGNLYVADSGNHAVRMITPEGVVTTYAGAMGVSGSTNGTRTNARFFCPVGIVFDGFGNMYVAERDNRCIRKITSDGVVSTLAGLPGSSGLSDGYGNNASFSSLHGIAMDPTGIIYVVETGAHAIRAVR